MNEELTIEDKKQKLFDYIEDLVANYVYYDRKGDEEISVEDVEQILTENSEFIEQLGQNFVLQLKKRFISQYHSSV